MAFPTKAKYVVIGTGIHGLSTAWHLAEGLKKKNSNGSNNDIVVIDKGGIASGASGIACGVVRNNYFQPAMRELMAHSVKVWESDPKTFHYHPIGYMQISPESMRKDVTTIYEQQKAIGYESTFVEGQKDCTDYMKNIFNDWQAKGITSVLHEKRGGYANNAASIYGLADKAESFGVRIITGTEVTGFKKGNNSKAVTGVITSKGTIDCEQVIVAAGPWVKSFWDMLELPKKISIKKESLMGGMSCDEVSLVPWQILKNSVSYCVTVSDDYISKTVKFLANSEFSDEKIIGGECSTPGIISLVSLCNDVEIKKKININEDSKVLLFGCEGDADEELYKKLLKN